MIDEPINNNLNMDGIDDYEAEQNLFRFFELLLKVDKRVNPQLYKKQNIEKNDR